MSRVELKRSLSLFQLTVFGLMYLCPIIVLFLFGVMSSLSQSTVPMAYFIAMFIILINSWSYCIMSTEFPNVGTAYVYARESIDDRVGFMVGWTILLDYLFVPLAGMVLVSVYMTNFFPNFPAFATIFIIAATVTTINILGIQIAHWFNFILLVFQYAMMLLFVILCYYHVVYQTHASFFNLEQLLTTAEKLPSTIAAAAVACYSFLGFDAVTTLSEEAKNPKRDIPRAIFLTTCIAGAGFIIMAYFLQIAHPSPAFNDPESGVLEIARMIAGDWLVATMSYFMIILGIGGIIPLQASAARLLYAMGRDGVLPKKFFGYLHPKFKTPALAILMIAGVILSATFLNITTSMSFINFGALMAFTFVNLSVIARVFRKNPLTLKNIFLFLFIPILGIIFDLYLMTTLDQNAIFMGGSWLLLGFIYLIYLTGGFKLAPPKFSTELT